MPKPASNLPDTEVIPKPAHDRRQYRSFSVEDKQRILEEADACQHRGDLGALLRREKIYSSQLQHWRQQLAARGACGLQNAPAGRLLLKDAKDRQIEMLQREKAKLEHRLQVAEGLLELQKKAFMLLEHLNSGNPS
jgi:transposase-like protein